jgi:hypothetical protein
LSSSAIAGAGDQRRHQQFVGSKEKPIAAMTITTRADVSLGEE